MEATAVSLARTVLDGVLSRAGTAVADQVARLLGVREEVDFIRNELEMMQAFLKLNSTHPEATMRNDTGKTWVKQVRDLAYDVEDCLLDFALYAARTSSSRAGSWLPGAVAERHRIAARIRCLKAGFEELNQRKLRYHIATNPAGAKEQAQLASSSMLPDSGGVHSPELAFKESDIIGRGDEKANLKLLISGAGEAEVIHEEDQAAATPRTSTTSLLIHEEDQAAAAAETPPTSTSTSLLRGLIDFFYSYYYIAPTTTRRSPPNNGGASTSRSLSVVPRPPPSGAVRVVSVCGMDGMGKSSLVRMVHNDPELLSEFECGAWVTVPHPLDNPDVFRRRLAKELDVFTVPQHPLDRGGQVVRRRRRRRRLGNKPELGGLAHEQEKIEELLREKRYMVVVDDVRTVEEWDNVWQVFQFDNNMGSRIIVTTPLDDVARYCAGAGNVAEGRKLIYKLKPLGDEASKDLLFRKVYKGSDYPLPPLDMKEEASHILRRCRGLPLAISTIGGLLANRPKTSIEWRKLHEHLGAELETDLCKIPKAIVSSYDDLPYHVKSMFLYLGIFPENHDIRRTRLLRRWMAEGYITKNRGMPAEEAGDRSYSDLINRSMIQPTKASLGVKADRCRVHSILLEIILPMSIEENQLFLVDKQSNEVPQSKIRHLVVSRWKKKDEKLRNIDASYIRSLTIFGECPASLISPKMRLLRVLDLEDTSNLKNDDLKHLGELQHLRYLCLRGTGISKLPSSLKNLRYLETLDIQDTDVRELPDGIAKLEKLCYLLAGVNFSKSLLRKMESGKENHKVSLLSCLCCNCSEFCKDFNLSVRAPDGIEKLQNLRMLGVINVGNGNDVTGRLKKLTNLTNLRRLGVEGLTEKEGQNLCQSIGELRLLQRLEVRSDSLTFLAQTPPTRIPRYLVSLRLCGNLSSLPEWICSLNDLAKVKLLRTQLKQEDIQHLQKLRNLTLLGLWEKSYIGDSLHFSAAIFPKLKFLDIDGLDETETVTIEKGVMPELKKLWVNNCQSLHDNESGLSAVPYLPNLNEVLFKKCGNKENLTKILQRQVSDHKKRPKLLVGSTIVRRTYSSTHTVTAD